MTIATLLQRSPTNERIALSIGEELMERLFQIRTPPTILGSNFRTITVIGRGEVCPEGQVNSMRFRSELLQPPPGNGSEATLTEIYPVYSSPDGHIAGEDDDLGDILDQGRFSQKD
jgi:hypothetical protein